MGREQSVLTWNCFMEWATKSMHFYFLPYFVKVVGWKIGFL